MLSILHIDRSKFFQKIVRDIISANGLSYSSCTTKSEALNILESMNVDLIITGLELDDGSGEDFVEEVNRSRFRTIPVIVVTATESLKLRQRLFTLGVVDYMLKKDMNTERLSSYIQTFVRGDELLSDLRRLRFAIVDDSQVGLNIVQNIFHLNSVRQARFFSSPRELLAEENPYDVFLVDLVLPEMSGEELIIELRRRYPNAIIIAMSSISNTKTISNVLLSGADDYLIKPFDAMIFMARIKTNVRVYTLMRDLQEKKAVLQQMADYDGLTEVFTHRKIVSYLSQQLAEPPSDGAAHPAGPAHPDGGVITATILFDLDNFKAVNDNYGHQLGDEVLKRFAAILKTHINSRGAAGRYGGEEFLAVVKVSGEDEARDILTRLYEELHLVRFEQDDIKLRCSAGVSLALWGNPQKQLHLADMALYKAKRDGKDRFEFAAEGLDPQ